MNRKLLLFIGVFSLITAIFAQETFAQNDNIWGGNWGGSVVGGVSVNAQGLINDVTRLEVQNLSKDLMKQLEAVPGELGSENSLRKISLKQINAVLRDCVEQNKAIPDSVRLMGGLLSIHYVVLVPEENDIILIGPAEGWKVDQYGCIVGLKSGKPTLQLEDFLVVLRAWNSARSARIISCSIDPTKEGVANFERTYRTLREEGAPFDVLSEELEKAIGLNEVKFTGVPENSRFASVMIAADYKMKRLGMGQERAPIRNFPSYISMNNSSSAQSRFWLTPEYDQILHDENKLTWKLSGLKIKALSENEFIDAQSGERTKSKVRDTAAEKWAANMTKRYEELSKAAPVFAELRNCMDIAAVVALIRQEGLMQRGNCDFSYLTDSKSIELPVYSVPKYVSPSVTLVQKNRLITLGCGGVEVNPFIAVGEAKKDDRLGKEREKLALSITENWFAN